MSKFPNFFEAFMKNSESLDLLFQILANKPDEEAQKSEEDAKMWEEKEQASYKYIYQGLADSFAMVDSADICELAIKSNQFKNILDIIAVISKEKPRNWSANGEAEEETSKAPEPSKKEKETGDKKPKKKKGVGYGSDSFGGGGFGFGGGPPGAAKKDDTWNVNQFVEKKKIKND